jgi:hypothetical protein
VGKTVGLTMANPIVAEDDYPIRMIERKRVGIADIRTTIYCGLGIPTDVEIMIADTINKSIYLAHAAHTDRLAGGDKLKELEDRIIVLEP